VTPRLLPGAGEVSRCGKDTDYGRSASDSHMMTGAHPRSIHKQQDLDLGERQVVG
jgi:hypothetical protein